MEKNPKVSICIPVYNGEKTIKDTILSIINQTYKNIEIIISDNKSTDNTVSVVNEFKDSRILFYKNDSNIGLARNWNKCLEKCKGEYIHFICADDTLSPECIEEKVKVMNSDKDIVMVINTMNMYNEEKKLVMKRKIYNRDTIIDGYKFAKKSLYRGNIYGGPSNVLFRKDSLEKSGVFPTNTYYTTDWEFTLRLSPLGKIAYLEKGFTHYIISRTNTTSKTSLKVSLKDDAQMIKNLENYKYLKITFLDKVIHNIAIRIRNLARIIYMKYFFK